MALKIDTLQCSVGVAALRDAGCGVLRQVEHEVGVAVPDVSSSSAESAGDWGTREWGMSIRGSRV
jgi:hypothetical protein